MVVAPPDWTLQRDGETWQFTPSGGEAAVIRYDERLRPIAGIVELIKAAPPPPGFEPLRADPVREVMTREGECGALVFVEGRMHGVPAELDLGFVILDDYYARVCAVTTDPALLPRFRGIVAALVISDTHVLGRLRRRRFRYTPPERWAAQQGLFEARWLPTDAGDPRAIMVGPALPKQAGLTDAILAGVLGGARPADVLRGPSMPVTTASGLCGRRWFLRMHGVDSDVVILEDADFVYCVRLDTSAGADRARDLLADLVESIQPVPAAPGSPPTSPFANWAE